MGREGRGGASLYCIRVMHESNFLNLSHCLNHSQLTASFVSVIGEGQLAAKHYQVYYAFFSKKGCRK